MQRGVTARYFLDALAGATIFRDAGLKVLEALTRASAADRRYASASRSVASPAPTQLLPAIDARWVPSR